MLGIYIQEKNIYSIYYIYSVRYRITDDHLDGLGGIAQEALSFVFYGLVDTMVLKGSRNAIFKSESQKRVIYMVMEGDLTGL